MIGILALLCYIIVDEGEGTILIEGDDIDEDISNISEADKSIVNKAKTLLFSNISQIPEGFMELNSNLESVIIKDSVEIVGSRSFYSCSSLKYVDFGQEIITISENSFSNCTELQHIVVGAQLEKICAEAFINTSIEELNFHSDVDIEKAAFKNCIKLIKIQSFRMKIKYGPYSFCGCTALMQLDLDSATLSEYAFYGCKNLKISTIFSNSEIPDFCFANTGITNIQIDSAISKIGVGSFSGCNLLKTVVGGNVTEVEEDSFLECSSLTKVLFPEIQIIHNRSFELCNSLESFIFGSNLITIGESAFHQTKFSSITFLSNLTEIGVKSFSNCNYLKELKFENTKVKSIPISAFCQCSILEKVTFDDSISTIEDLAFANCTSLKEIAFGTNFETMQNNSFEGCNAINKIILAGNLQDLATFINERNSITEIEFGDTKIVPTNLFLKAPFISKVSFGGSVVQIQTSAFEECENLETIIFGSNTEHINDHAFYKCKKLTTISNTNSIKVIGDYAFEETAIPKLNLWNSLQSIGVNSFASCSDLESVDFGESTPAVWEYAFKGCNYLKTVTFRKLSKVARGAFSSTGITSISFPYCEELGDHAFADCSKLTSADLGKLSTISQSCFEGCGKLQKVTALESSVVEEKAFYHCSMLSDLKLGKVKTVGNSAFVECDSLKSFDFDFVESVGEKSFLGSGLSGSVNIKFTAGISAFEMCTSITSAIVSTDVISSKLFESCLHLQKIEINTSKISDRAFADCNSLNSITFNSDITEISETAFLDINKNVEVKMMKKSDGIVSKFLNITKSLVNLGVGFDTVPENHFYNVNSITNVSLFAAKTVSKSGFENCQNLATLNLGTIETIGITAFSHCVNLVSVKASYNNLFKKIDKGAFSNCTHLKQFDFVPSIQIISSEAFHACALSGNIMIPINCTTVESKAFSNCSISSVVFCGVKINGAKDAFDNLKKATVSYSFNGTELFGLRPKIDNTPCGGRNPLNDNPGAIAAIVIGSVSVVVVIIIVVILVLRKRKSHSAPPDAWDSMLVGNESMADVGEADENDSIGAEPAN